MTFIRIKLEFQNVINIHTRYIYGEWQEKEAEEELNNFPVWATGVSKDIGNCF